MVNATLGTVDTTFLSTTDVVLKSATFTGTSTSVSELTLVGTFTPANSGSYDTTFSAVVFTKVYTDKIPDTALTATNTFALTSSKDITGVDNLKYFTTSGAIGVITLPLIDATATKFYMYVMRTQTLKSAPKTVTTYFSKDYIEISPATAVSVNAVTATLGTKTFTVKYEEELVEKTFKNNLNVSYFARINASAGRKIIEVLSLIKIDTAVGTKKSLDKEVKVNTARSTVAEWVTYFLGVGLPPSAAQELALWTGGAAVPATSTTVPATASATASAGYYFNKNLQLGSSGADVLALQKFLNANGYRVAATGSGSPGNETSYFGTKTKAAVIRFQQRNGIRPADGKVGRKTRMELNGWDATTAPAPTPAAPTVNFSINTQGNVFKADSTDASYSTVGRFEISTTYTLTFIPYTPSTVATAVTVGTYSYSTGVVSIFIKTATGATTQASVVYPSVSPTGVVTLGTLTLGTFTSSATGIVTFTLDTTALPTLPSRDVVYVSDLEAANWINTVRTLVGTANVDTKFDNNYNNFDTAMFIMTATNPYFVQFRNILFPGNNDVKYIDITVTVDNKSSIIIDITSVNYSTEIMSTASSIFNDTAKILQLKKLLVGLKYDTTKLPFKQL